MSGNSFRSVFMVASCAGAALACYMVSLRVASERAALEQVQTEIVLAERDIRLLQTEIGTRGRLAQLERWNVKVLALSAPSADQFVGNGFELARMVTPKRKVDLEAPVVLAAAPAGAPAPRLEGAPGGAGAAGPAEAAEPVPTADLLHSASLKRGPAPPKNSVDKPAAAVSEPVTRPARIAKTDPLAPLSKSSPQKPAKDSPTKP